MYDDWVDQFRLSATPRLTELFKEDRDYADLPEFMVETLQRLERSEQK
jgi:hypothetical protein